MNYDKNVAVRIPWDLWEVLEDERQKRNYLSHDKVTLSDIVREALEKYVGDTWITNQKNEQK